MDVDRVLAEMREIGAVGRSPKPRRESVQLDEVEVERARPGVAVRDARGDRMVELLTRAVDQLASLQATLRELRDVWVVGDVPKVERADKVEVVSLEGGDEIEDMPVPTVRESEVTAPESEDYESARAAAVAKIRGGFSGDPLKAPVPAADEDDDDNIPYVGQDRVRPSADVQVVRSVKVRK